MEIYILFSASHLKKSLRGSVTVQGINFHTLDINAWQIKISVKDYVWAYGLTYSMFYGTVN
jgi:hypothetical protein